MSMHNEEQDCPYHPLSPMYPYTHWQAKRPRIQVTLYLRLRSGAKIFHNNSIRK